MSKDEPTRIEIGSVKGDTIVSQNQKGGTTGHTVSTNTEADGEESSRKRIVWWITIAASIVAILAYFGIGPF